ncbi:MAG: hypothetical protein AB8I80_24140, partial [Anaerolineae bacterium]
QQAMEQMGQGGDSEGIGMDPTGFVADLPLASVLGFFGGELAAPPEQVVRDLLAQVKSEKGQD